MSNTSIPMHEVNSSQISYIGYDTNSQELYVKFRNTGKVYKYFNVPDNVWNDFKNSASVGKYFTANIKSKYSFEQI